MKQGEVYWHNFRAPDKRRPVLILTRNTAIPYLTGISVAQITSTVRGAPSEVLLTPGDDGVFEECAVNTHNIQTIQKSQIGEFITELSPANARRARGDRVRAGIRCFGIVTIMLTDFDEILSAALSLPPDERAMLADHLLASLDGPNQKEIDAAWAEEVERRSREIDEGKVELIDGELVMERLRARLAK